MNQTLPTEMGQDITGLYSLFQYIQGITEGWFFLMIQFAIFIIVFISLKNYSTSRAFAGAAFLNFVLGVMLGILGFISPTWSYLGIVLVGIAVVWLHIENSR